MTQVHDIILLYIAILIIGKIVFELQYRIHCKQYLIKCIDIELKQYLKTDKIFGDSYLAIFKDIENTIYKSLNNNKSHINNKKLKRLIHHRLLESNVKESIDVARGLYKIKNKVDTL